MDAADARGAGFEFTPILKPLEPFRDRLTVVSGLTAGPTVQNGGHAVAPASYLTGNIQPKQTEGSDVLGAVTVDQVIAKAVGQDTPFPSLEVATEDFSTSIGACDTGYSCIYMNTISWAGPTSPLPMETNPRVRVRADVRRRRARRRSGWRGCRRTAASSTA